jgi:zinc-ribbon domain
MAPDTCPNCGADVPRNARACPECGACEETGWSDDAQTGDLGVPEESFDYREFVQREFGAKRMLPRGIGWFWWTVSLAAIGVLLWFMLR